MVNVFFDVDGTILGDEDALRPHTRAVFEQLIASGHTIYIWSGIGLRRREVHEAGLHPLVSGIYVKPIYEFVASLRRYGIPVKPDFVVDDYPMIVEHFGGLHIKRYDVADDSDEELLAVPALVAALASARAEAEAEEAS